MPGSLTDLAGLKVNAADFLAAILETVGQPVWVVDPRAMIRYANPAAIAAVGYNSASELLGRHSHEALHYQHPDGTPYPAAECPMLLPRTTGEVVRSDLDWFFRRDGSMFPVSYVSVPLEMPEGRGAVVAFHDIEDRLRADEVLREQEAILTAQQAALRRVATLVAGGAASAEVFAAIAKEVAQLLGMALVVIWRYEPERPARVVGAWSDRPHPFQDGTDWPVDERTAAAMLPDMTHPARVEDFGAIGGPIPDAIREAGIRSGAGAAIVVDDDLWGVMGAGVAEGEPLPGQIEDRLAQFTELVASAIANTASRAELARLADEQAALRRVATLVARGVPPREVFAAVAGEVGLLLGVDVTHMARYEADGTATGVAAWGAAGGDRIPVGTRVDLRDETVAGLVSRTGQPARMNDYERASGDGAALGRDLGLRSSVGAPIVVDQCLWGVMIASSKGERPLPLDAESRIAAFTELVATAISNTEARTQVRRLADEQAALRRVATLVARGVPSSELFGAVAEEIGRLFGAELAGMIRYETDTTLTPVATWTAVGEHADVPDRITFSVVSPILVEERLWGALAVHTRQLHPFPKDTESRLENFTELVATAISNIQARSDVAASRARIVAATDDERRRVVRDLHDGAQQRLVHTMLLVAQARQSLLPQQEPASEFMAEALAQAEAATEELRELAHGLLPEILTHGGLRVAIRALALRAPVPVEVAVSVDRLPAAVEATAYFVVAEALTNVAKHACATVATVQASIENGILRVHVRDDGVGGARPDGSGLVGLADRLAVLNGRLRVESPADGGTLVAADIPVRE